MEVRISFGGLFPQYLSLFHSKWFICLQGRLSRDHPCIYLW